MTTRSVLITGCSSGIGLDAAHALRMRGWNVFAACRAETDCKRLRLEGFRSPRLDYCDSESIKATLDQVLTETHGTLDALFNNGAYGLPGAVEDLPTEALREIFEANLFGWHELIRAVIPVMRGQEYGRIVQCSSVLGFIPMRWRAAYVATKYALEGYTDTLRIELRGTSIRVSLIEPGPITTKFRVNSIPHFERWIDWKNSPHTKDYEQRLTPRLYASESTPDPFELPPAAVSEKLLHALESRRPRPRYHVTKVTHFAGMMRRLLPTRALDQLIARMW